MEAIVEDLRQNSLQFETIAKQVGGFRKGLGGTLNRINAGYLSAFERMMTEFAKLQKKKTRKQAKRILEQDKAVSDLEKENKELRSLVQRLEITVKSQESILSANKTTISDLDDDLRRCHEETEQTMRVDLAFEDRKLLEKQLKNSQANGSMLRHTLVYDRQEAAQAAMRELAEERSRQYKEANVHEQVEMSVGASTRGRT
jgi:hypothetical protein